MALLRINKCLRVLLSELRKRSMTVWKVDFRQYGQHRPQNNWLSIEKFLKLGPDLTPYREVNCRPKYKGKIRGERQLEESFYHLRIEKNF